MPMMRSYDAVITLLQGTSPDQASGAVALL